MRRLVPKHNIFSSKDPDNFNKALSLALILNRMGKSWNDIEQQLIIRITPYTAWHPDLDEIRTIISKV